MLLLERARCSWTTRNASYTSLKANGFGSFETIPGIQNSYEPQSKDLLLSRETYGYNPALIMLSHDFIVPVLLLLHSTLTNCSREALNINLLSNATFHCSNILLMQIFYSSNWPVL